MDGDEAASPTRAPRWTELGLPGKGARVAAFALVATYLTLALARPMPDGNWLKERVAPLEKKVARFRLSSPWRMFTSEAKFGYIVLQFQTSDGEYYQVENFRWEGKPWLDRVRDARLRRIQAKLKRERYRRKRGRDYLTFVCEKTKQDIPEVSTIEVIRAKPMILDRNGKKLADESAMLIGTFDCNTKRFKTSS